MFKLLSTLAPPSRPRTTEITATNVMPMMMATCVPMPLSMPKRKLRPLAACCAPKPSEVARPKIVASTAIISITCPNQPQVRSFSSGKKPERMVNGRPLLKLKKASDSPTTA